MLSMNTVNDYEQQKTVDEQEEEEHQWKKEVDYKQLNIEHDEYTILSFGDSSMSINSQSGNEQDG